MAVEILNLPSSEQKFPSNKEVLNYDICVLFVEARGYVRFLSKRLAMGDNQIVGIYYDAYYHLVQLFDTANLLIVRSGKLKSWKQRERKYKKFFNEIQEGIFEPEKLLKVWEALSKDISEAGIYDGDLNQKKIELKKDVILEAS